MRRKHKKQAMIAIRRQSSQIDKLTLKPPANKNEKKQNSDRL